MITVEKVIKSNQKNAAGVSEQNEEMLRTGKIKAVTQTYWPMIIGAAAAIAAGIGAIWWLGKKDVNGPISD
jgi:hypothetical protein